MVIKILLISAHQVYYSQWYHIAVVFNDPNKKIYANGSMILNENGNSLVVNNKTISFIGKSGHPLDDSMNFKL